MHTDHSSKTEITGLWLSLTELSAAKGVGKPALSERVARLEREGVITTRPGKGRQKLINVAEFDRAVGQVTNLARELGETTRRRNIGEEPKGAPVSISAAYTREQARRMGYLADISGLELGLRRGEYITIAELKPMIEAAGRATARAIDSLSDAEESLRRVARQDDAAPFDRAWQIEVHRIRDAVVAAVLSAMPGGAAAHTGSSDGT